ncbi:MAG: hypothetical protein ACI4NG_00375 [Candidatus Gallimonas sp.]
MRKLWKNMALVLAAALTVCAGAFLSACGDNAYSVKLQYEDGTAVNGKTDGLGGLTEKEVFIQWCLSSDNGKCSTPVAVDENGKASCDAESLQKSLGEGKYDVHVLYLSDSYTYEVPQVSAPGEIVITVKAK